MTATLRTRVAALSSPEARPHGHHAAATNLPNCRRCDRPMVTQKQVPRPCGAVRGAGRGLCHGCYSWARINQRLADYPVMHRRAADVAEDYADLRAQGLTDREIAVRLGLKLDSLHRALSRARTYEKAAA